MSIAKYHRPQVPDLRWVGLLAIALTPSCTVPHAATTLIDESSNSAAIPASPESMVGKHFWLNPPHGSTVHVCVRPESSPPWKQCPQAGSGGFRITQIVKGTSNAQLFEIEVDDGKRGYLPVEYREYLSTEDPSLREDQTNAEQRSKTCNPTYLKVGMGWNEVERFCPGSPRRRVVSATTAGDSVMLVYTPGPTYVQSLNDKVISVQRLEGY
jgi:hypothetical protein